MFFDIDKDIPVGLDFYMSIDRSDQQISRSGARLFFGKFEELIEPLGRGAVTEVSVGARWGCGGIAQQEDRFPFL